MYLTPDHTVGDSAQPASFWTVLNPFSCCTKRKEHSGTSASPAARNPTEAATRSVQRSRESSANLTTRTPELFREAVAPNRDPVEGVPSASMNAGEASQMQPFEDTIPVRRPPRSPDRFEGYDDLAVRQRMREREAADAIVSKDRSAFDRLGLSGRSTGPESGVQAQATIRQVSKEISRAEPASPSLATSQSREDSSQGFL